MIALLVILMPLVFMVGLFLGRRAEQQYLQAEIERLQSRLDEVKHQVRAALDGTLITRLPELSETRNYPRLRRIK